MCVVGSYGGYDMKTIYDKEGVTVTLYEDDNDVDIHIEGRHVITMTVQEFDGICQGWRAINPQPQG